MQANINWLTDPTVFQVNRLDAHSDHISYPTREEAESGITSLRQSLDGQWLFSWSRNPSLREAEFWQDGYDLSGFSPIIVPGHMETQGFDRIQYINKLYPWDGHAELRPPQIDWDYNPVGSYVRFFDLAPNLRDRDICISFQGIEQAAFIWLNGHFVGYCEDTFTPSDFDLTPYIREKNNRLCVEVYKRSSAAWLEDQDFFRFSGIFRPVYLYAKPILEDIWIQSTLNPDGSGNIRFRLRTSAQTVRARISHPTDGLLFDGILELTEKDSYLFSQTITFDAVKVWDYGRPELYDVLLVADSTEYVPYRTGFRRIEIGADKIMYLNGKRLMINGVNRHEWNAHAGRAISVADMEAAMAIIKENNINAVRTCHYPNRTEWYHICDENGIYLMDETNLETHGSWQKGMTVDPEWNVPGSIPEWKECVLDRAKSMFERDKNHVCILFWSCGNEAFCGSNIVAMADYFRSVDPSRLVHYEGVYWPRGVVNGKPNSPHWRPEYETVSDMESRMYATPSEIREYLENDPPKPYISCEFMHNMGNSLGGMESYVTLGDEFPMYQGGFIWDYMDQALWHKDVNGREVLGYGGDFEERQSDYNFSGNGIVTADGTPKPCMQEVKYWHSSPEIRAAWDEKNASLSTCATMPVHDHSEHPLKITHGDGALGIRGKDFEILFDYNQGGPTSIRWGETQWLWRAPKPAFWRAPTENDYGCGFPGKSAIWSAVDRYVKSTSLELLEESTTSCTVRYSFTADVMPGLLAQVAYHVDTSGNLDVTVSYEGSAGRPQLPLFGLRFETPVPMDEVTWQGLSGETYPDRYKGAQFGKFSEKPDISNYLVPQECRNHMKTHWAKLHRGDQILYLEKLDDPFHFSAIPYTPHQLEAAFHREELPLPSRTVVTVCGRMRGVGGIDTWGNDVEAPYHVRSDENIRFAFRIRG